MGGWTLEAAEAIGFTGGEAVVEEIVLLLAALVDASLVLREGRRYRLTCLTRSA